VRHPAVQSLCASEPTVARRSVRSVSTINVRVVSAEEAEHGTAEFWLADELFAYTRLEDGELVLRIEPRRDGAPVVVGAHSLATALARAKALLDAY
jgi:hypothetical protein